jgi:hypothetical protein
MSTITLGIDLGDRMTTTCQLDAAGAVTARGKAALQSFNVAMLDRRATCERDDGGPLVTLHRSCYAAT